MGVGSASQPLTYSVAASVLVPNPAHLGGVARPSAAFYSSRANGVLVPYTAEIYHLTGLHQPPLSHGNVVSQVYQRAVCLDLRYTNMKAGHHHDQDGVPVSALRMAERLQGRTGSLSPVVSEALRGLDERKAREAHTTTARRAETSKRRPHDVWKRASHHPTTGEWAPTRRCANREISRRFWVGCRSGG